MAGKDEVIVPDFVGQPVHIARIVAADSGLSLATDDPDGPGLGARTWLGLFWITSQEPPAGHTVTAGTHIRITFVPDDRHARAFPRRRRGLHPRFPRMRDTR